MTAKIKICGVTLADDAARIAAAGVEYLGLNFWPTSKRYLAPERAPRVAEAARASGEIQLVGVFVDADLDDVIAVLQQVELDVIQLHGGEDAAEIIAIAAATKKPIWKAIAAGSTLDIEQLEDWTVDAILLDTPSPERGGTGKTFDWTIAREARRRYPAGNLVLAGGLDAGNVAEAIATVGPWAVDVATGVETAPGIKDAAKIGAFVAAIRGATR